MSIAKKLNDVTENLIATLHLQCYSLIQPTFIYPYHVLGTVWCLGWDREHSGCPQSS